MPVKRRFSKEREGAISPSTVAAYAHALALREQYARGEVDLDAVAEGDKVVERALSIRMWQPSVFGLDTFWELSDDPDYQRALDLRDRLDAALAELKRRRQAAAPAPEPETAPA
jgi:hypothetical protein